MIVYMGKIILYRASCFEGYLLLEEMFCVAIS